MRLRRDFAAILSLVRAHAILHQASRHRDRDGRIVASLDDYTAVSGLVGDLVAEGLGMTVREVVRETVKVVEQLQMKTTDEGVTVAAVAKALGIERPAALRRTKMAIRDGYLKNLEERRGRPAKLVIGEPLPDEQEILPSPLRLLAVCEMEYPDAATQMALDVERRFEAWRASTTQATVGADTVA